MNDIVLQKLLLDRRLVLSLLDNIGIPTPRRLVVNRDGGPIMDEDVKSRLEDTMLKKFRSFKFSLASGGSNRAVNFAQLDHDTISLDNVTMRKPFVEKPVSGEDHNIWIYYPSLEGSGVRKLFRKVANKSSEFICGVNNVRTDGSYIYEEFIDVDNAEDVKVYTVGPNAFYAETRKSPVIDGIVRRTAKDGKELRYITQLTEKEQTMAQKISTVFGQTVCGFDLLRIKGKSYVIDVNGWSFVKGNDNYYDLCANTLRNMFLEHARKRKLILAASREPNFDNQWRLKAYLSVLRHGDRTPKQKMKFYTSSQPFLNLLEETADDIVLRKANELLRVIDAAKQAKSSGKEDSDKMDQLISILENKYQLPGTKVQIKPFFSKDDGMVERIQVIVKWGGEFTHA